MNNWVIAGIIFAVLLIGGVAFVSAISTNQTDDQPKITSCTGCGGKCTAGNNCGLATCGATNELATPLNDGATREIARGKCGCGQK